MLVIDCGMAIGDRELPAAGVVRAVRERRFSNGVFCPRCDSTSVVRWGRFAGRQRYRCRACGRCFSDLTETAFRYIKKLDAWPAYFRCLEESRTVRSSAAATGVAVSTAFRWRHLILQALEERPRPPFGPVVEFAHAEFRYSIKGRRRDAGGWTPAMYFGRAPAFARPGCNVVLAHDRSGNQRTIRVDTATLTGYQLCVYYDDLLPGECTLLTPRGRFSPFAALLPAERGSGRRLVQASPFRIIPGTDLHNFNAFAALRRLRGWLTGFRGVATRYLPSYLEWRSTLDRIELGEWLPGLVAAGGPGVVTAGPDAPGDGAAPTLPANKCAGAGDGGFLALRPAAHTCQHCGAPLPRPSDGLA
jgi:transposase-like protein